MVKKPSTKKNSNRRLALRDVYGMGQSLTGSPHVLSVKEFQDVELYSIGLITVQWAYLEHIILYDTQRRSDRAKLPKLPDDATSTSFKRRLNAWRLIVEATVKRKAERERLLRIASRIASVESDRHKVTHGLWQWTPSDPIKLRAYSYRPGVAFNDSYSFERLGKIVDRIAAINFELSYPTLPKDRKAQSKWFAREHIAALKSLDFTYISRSFLLQMAGKALPTLHRAVKVEP